MKPILLVDCYLDPKGGARNFLPALGDRPVRVVRPAHGQPIAAKPGELGDISGAIITGSAASCCEPPPWAEPIVDLVHQCADRELPVLGVCYGHQMIARAFAGPDAVRLAAAPEIGWLDIELTGEDPLLAGLGARFRAFVSHNEEVKPTAGGDLRIFARSEQCSNHAFRAGERTIWGVQFHAEMGYDEARELVLAKARARPELGLVPEEMLARACRAYDTFTRIVANFLAYV